MINIKNLFHENMYNKTRKNINIDNTETALKRVFNGVDRDKKADDGIQTRFCIDPERHSPLQPWLCYRRPRKLLGTCSTTMSPSIECKGT